MLSSGKAVICYNPTNKLRDIMRISVSEDGGETWPHYKVIITSPVAIYLSFKLPVRAIHILTPQLLGMATAVRE